MPGTPKKVGKSADIVCVRSTTLWKLRAAAAAGTAGAWAAAGAAAMAAKPAAAAPVVRKNPRRVSARCTVCSHPGTHIFEPPDYAWRMIFSENRPPLFGIMRRATIGLTG